MENALNYVITPTTGSSPAINNTKLKNVPIALGGSRGKLSVGRISKLPTISSKLGSLSLQQSGHGLVVSGQMSPNDVKAGGFFPCLDDVLV